MREYIELGCIGRLEKYTELGWNGMMGETLSQNGLEE